MKWNQLVRTVSKAGVLSGISAALGLGTVACSRDYVVAYSTLR